MPSLNYYVQRMHAAASGDASLPVSCVRNGDELTEQLDRARDEHGFVVSAVRDSLSGRLFVKIVNALPAERSIVLRRTGEHGLRPVRRTELAGPDPDAGRSHEPAPFSPRESGLGSFETPFTVPPYSFTVLEFQELP